jgi:density-regulated protein DRP1
MQELTVSSQTTVVKPKSGFVGTVLISKENRTKKKSLTSVAGLDEFGIKLKDTAKIFGKKFACGCAVVEGSVPGSEEIAIQGDFQNEVAEFIAEKIKEVPKGRIFFIEKLKKTRAFPDAAEDEEANVQTLISDAQAIIDDL